MKNFSAIDIFAMVLVIVGGLNWGLVGLANFDLVANIFGTMTVLSRVIYILVGLSAIYVAASAMKMGKK